MAILLDGKSTAAAVRQTITRRTAALRDQGFRAPGLAVILVGDDPASRIYVRNKQKACEEIGFVSRGYTMPAHTDEAELIALIDDLNRDKTVDGILVQLPLPKHLNETKILAAIAPDKDVDAFSAENVGKILLGRERFLPCTPAGVMELLEQYRISVAGKRCVVIGRSNIVGKPMALLLLAKDGTVTVCHSRTKNLEIITKEADLVVAAVGRPKLVTASMVKKGAVVIDVGMNRDEQGKLCGDVDFDAVAPRCSYITPVPGGVGPMTIAMLMKNTWMAACDHLGVKGSDLPIG